MTQPAAATIEREQSKLFLTDAELIRRLGVPEKDARVALRHFETKTDFPRRQKMWGDRRYWPAVKAWLDRNCGTISPPQPRSPRHDRQPS